MKDDSATRRNVLRGVAVALSGSAAGCSSPRDEENSYVTVSKGNELEIRDDYSVGVEDIYEEKMEADLELTDGPSIGNFSKGDRVICTVSGEDPVGVYLEDIDYEEDKVEFRVEEDSDCFSIFSVLYK